MLNTPSTSGDSTLSDNNAGVSSEHAEAEASALAEVFSGHWDSLATKQDVAQLEANMSKLEANMATKQDVAQLEANMGKLEANIGKLEIQIEQRATKADLAVLEACTKEEMGRLHGEMLGLSHQMGMLRWMMGLMVAGIVSLMLKAFVLSSL